MTTFQLETARRQYGAGDFAGALQTLQGLDVERGSEALLIYAASLARVGQRSDAVLHFKRILLQDPDCHEALTWMATLAASRSPEDAVRYAGRAIALRPTDATGYGTLGNLLLSLGRVEEAIAASERAVELESGLAEHRHNLGLAYLAGRRHREAIDAFLRAIELAPERSPSYLALASTYELFGMAGPALDILSRALAHRPLDPALHSAAAKAFASIRNNAAAESHHRRAVEFSPKGQGAYASWLLNQGRFDGAADVFRSMIRDGVDLPYAYYGLVQAKRLKPARVPEIERLLNRQVGSRGEMFLHYALGKTHESAGDYESAMRHFNAANERAKALFHRGRAVDLDRFEQEQSNVRKLAAEIRRRADLCRCATPPGSESEDDGPGFCDPALPSATASRSDCQRVSDEFHDVEHLNQALAPPEAGKGPRRELGGKANPVAMSDEGPIFIVGMIRSGTTLLDQIVSSHPDVASGGELRFWYEELGRRAACGVIPTPEDLQSLANDYLRYARLLAQTEGRFTDKMPLNYTFVGPILAALPNSRFLHIRRNPLDVALSIWTTYFGQGPAFAYDKSSIVAAIRAYQRQMAHWCRALPPDRLLELKYEDLIDDAEPTIRRVIGFCSLTWDDACLRHEGNAGAINTPSRWQARQPIYRTSMERWRRYEPWLGEFAELLEEP